MCPHTSAPHPKDADWSVIVSADWSKERKKREVYAASAHEKRVWRLEPPGAGWEFESVVAAAEKAGRDRSGPALIGFDAPIGVPASFIGPSRARSFTAWLRSPRGTDAFMPVRTPGEWTVSRPFFIVPGGKGSLGAFFARMEEEFAVMPLRRIERMTQGKSVFIAGGIPGSVGCSAIDVWCGLRKCQSQVAIWPFDGRIEELRRGSKPVVGEIYPRMAYGLAIGQGEGKQDRVTVAKTDRRERVAFLHELMEGDNWVRRRGVAICNAEIAAESEDAFDALVTAAALLRCVLESTPLSNRHLDDSIAEGGILGAGSVYLNRREQPFRASEGVSRRPVGSIRKVEALGDLSPAGSGEEFDSAQERARSVREQGWGGGKERVRKEIVAFLSVARLAGLEIGAEDLLVEVVPGDGPHPGTWRDEYVAVYAFFLAGQCLKVGKAGVKSRARFVSQHYGFRAPNTLAKCLHGGKGPHRAPADLLAAVRALPEKEVGRWIRQNTERVNVFVPVGKAGRFGLSLLEAFLHCRLDPDFEG